MLKGLIGKKLGMTRLFMGEGRVVPVTMIELGPCTVVQVKTPASDKYAAVQLGYGVKKAKRTTKPLAGHFKKASVDPKAVLREFPVADPAAYSVGQEIKADLFAPGEKIKVTGTSKGRGFSGVVKRHGFGGGRDTHGCTTHDAPGSIGASAYPSRVFKGRRLPGQYGSHRTTVRNLSVVDVRPEQNLMLVKGAIPGAVGGIVLVEKA